MENNTIQWLSKSIQNNIHALRLPLKVQILSSFDESLEDNHLIWLPQVMELNQHVSLLEQLKGYLVVVTTQQEKQWLIKRGYTGSKILVCSFWGPSLSDVQTSPAPFSKVQQQINDSVPYELEIARLNRQGGIGMVTDRDDLESFFIYLLAGVPVAVAQQSKLAELVSQYRVGFVFSSPDELNKKHISKEQFQTWSRNSSIIGNLMRQGILVRHTLLQATSQAILSSTDVANDHPRYGIHVMDSFATLDYIAQHHCSVARLGDGEISLLNGAAQVFQDDDPELRQRLDEIAKQGSSDHLLVCLSDTFHDLDRYVPKAQDWWRGHLNVFKDYYRTLGKLSHLYGNTMVTRPYMDLQDRSQVGEVFRRIKQWWNNRNLLIVEGAYTRSGVGNDLYDNALSVQRIICPPKNAWSKHQEIEQAIKRYGQGKLVLVMLGMAATVIAADLAEWGQVIDSGHLDPEYEWYKMGTAQRVAIQGKHTAEMNYDQGVPQ